MTPRETVHYDFGPFRLDATEQRLWRNGEEITLTLKAFKVLLALVEHPGRTLLKDELMSIVWPDSVVEEKNLADNVSILRQALGDDAREPDYIKTIPRRGYRFMGEVTEVRGDGTELLLTEHTHERIVIEETVDEADFAQRSNGILDGAPARVGSPRRSWFRRPGQSVALLVLGVVATGTIAFGAWKWGLVKWSFGGREAPMAPPAIAFTTMTNSGVDGCATISSDGRFIAYSQNHNQGTGSLYIQQVGTNSGVQLLPPGERFFGTISFSPDGAHLYYIVFDKHDPKGALYKIPALGGPPERLASLHGYMFGLSPDEKNVAYIRNHPDGDKRQLVVAALDGSGERALLTRSRSEMSLSFCPAWSPDGLTIAFAANNAPQASQAMLKIHSIEVSTGQFKLMSAEEWADVGKLVWAADGGRLYFVGRRLRSGQQLYYIEYPGGVARQLTSGLHSYGNYGLGVSADGKTIVADSYIRTSYILIAGANGASAKAVRLTPGDHAGSSGLTTLVDGRIVYVTRVGGVSDLWIMNEDGSGARPLTADTYAESEVIATPDERYLIFVSDREGFSHLYRIDLDGTNLTRLTSGETNDSSPDCSPDGRWLVYVSTIGNRTTIRKLPLEGGASVDLIEGAVAPIFSPDGNWLSCIFPSDSVINMSRLAVIPVNGGPASKSFEVVSFAWSHIGARWTPDGQSLVYRRRETAKGDLWNLWRQPLDGGEPRPLTDFKSEGVFRYAFTRNGERLVLSCGRLNVNVSLITGFH